MTTTQREAHSEQALLPRRAHRVRRRTRRRRAAARCRAAPRGGACLGLASGRVGRPAETHRQNSCAGRCTGVILSIRTSEWRRVIFTTPPCGGDNLRSRSDFAVQRDVTERDLATRNDLVPQDGRRAQLAFQRFLFQISFGRRGT